MKYIIMSTINIPFKNTWGHLIDEYTNEKQQRINEKIKEAITNMYIEILNHSIKKYGYIDTRKISCDITRKKQQLIINMCPIKAIVELDYFK